MPPERTIYHVQVSLIACRRADQLELQQHEGERSRAPLTFMLLELKLVSSFCMRISDTRYMVMPPERTLPCTGIADRNAEGADQLELQQHEGERSRAPLTFMLLELKLVSSFCMRSAIPGTWSCRQREHLPCTGIADRIAEGADRLSSST